MSKHETWRTRLYWEQVGGLLIEEFIVVKGNKNQGKRALDGLIVLNEEKAIYDGNTYDIKDKDVVVIQTKAHRIGMYLLGQAYFSKLLVEKHQPRSVKSVAICKSNDTAMAELAEAHNVEIVVIKDDQKPDSD
ncbi:hypothetical protein BKI52_04410 [marine bacterium AO1-C]|nr:hypothetical protein BKI52_04410 [marine bacterium AO1-C]